MTGRFVVQVLSGGRWRKVRGVEGGPWNTHGRAERVARSRESAPRRSSSTDGLPHRVIETSLAEIPSAATAPTGAEQEGDMPATTTTDKASASKRTAKPDPKPTRRRGKTATPAQAEPVVEAETPAAPAAEVDASSLADQLIALVRRLHPEVEVVQKATYSRLTAGDKTLAYLNGGKRALTVDVPLGSGGINKVKVGASSDLPKAVHAVEARMKAVASK